MCAPNPSARQAPDAGQGRGDVEPARRLAGAAQLRHFAPTHQPDTRNGAVNIAQPHARKYLTIFEHLEAPIGHRHLPLSDCAGEGTADHRPRFAEVRLRMPRRMHQRYEHLQATATMLAHVVLHDRVTASEPILVPKPVEHALGRVALLARPSPILDQPLVNEVGEPVELRAANRCLRRCPGGTENRSIFLTRSREIPK